MCSPSRKSCSTQYIFLDVLYVIEERISFNLVYRLLLLKFVLGWAIFYHRSPGLYLFYNDTAGFRSGDNNTSTLKNQHIYTQNKITHK